MSGLPTGWADARLDDLADEVTGSIAPDPSTRYELYSVPAVPLGIPENVMGGVIGSSKRPVAANDVLLCKINPRINRVWFVGPFNSRTQIASTEFIPLRLPSGNEITARYLMWYLRSPKFRAWIKLNAVGATGSHTRAKSPAILRQSVPIAPLNEQKRIVAAIEEKFSRLDAAVGTVEHVSLNLTRMRAAVLQAAVTGRLVPRETTDSTGVQLAADMLVARGGKKPLARSVPSLFTYPETWGVGSLESFTDPVRVICYGILMPRVKFGGTVPYVEVKDLRSRTLSIKTLHRTSDALHAAFARSVLSEGDVVLAIRGSYDRAHVVPGDVTGANVSRDVARIAPLPGLDPRYLTAYLMSPPALRYLRERARGVAVKGVNIADLRALPIALPSLPEQKRISDELDRVTSTFDDLETSLATQFRRIESLRSAILDAAFSGKLVRQDPSDEPASSLLQRIAAGRASFNGRDTSRAPNRAAARRKVVA